MFGLCCAKTGDWSSSAFEENKITEVEKIEFHLTVRNADDYFGDPLVDEAVKLEP